MDIYSEGGRISFRYYSVLWPLAKAASGVRISFRYLKTKRFLSLIRRRNSFPPRKIPYFCALTKFRAFRRNRDLLP